MLCVAPRQHPDSAAAAKQAAADRELRDKLLACCNGNFTLGPALDDLSPIKLILEVVPLDHIMFAIRQKVDRRCYPANPTLTSWRDPRLLKAVEERVVLAPDRILPQTASSGGRRDRMYDKLPPP